jgi:hypothetical protein
MHPFIIGELACGSLADRRDVLELLQDLPAAVLGSVDTGFRVVDARPEIA